MVRFTALPTHTPAGAVSVPLTYKFSTRRGPYTWRLPSLPRSRLILVNWEARGNILRSLVEATVVIILKQASSVAMTAEACIHIALYGEKESGRKKKKRIVHCWDVNFSAYLLNGLPAHPVGYKISASVMGANPRTLSSLRKTRVLLGVSVGSHIYGMGSTMGCG